MKVLQIGDGNGLTLSTTNTSFLVDDFILVDCGFNVPEALIRYNLINKVKHVLITHSHSDHIGGLESLIYYFRYVLKLNPPKIIVPYDLKNEIRPHFKNCKIHVGHLNKITKMDEFIHDVRSGRESWMIRSDDNIWYYVDFIKNNTHGIPAKAYSIFNNSEKKLAFFTGDSRYNEEYVKHIEDMKNEYDGMKYKIFHDYTHISDLSIPHCSSLDMICYPDWFLKNVEYCHCGAHFEKPKEFNI